MAFLAQSIRATAGNREPANSPMADFQRAIEFDVENATQALERAKQYSALIITLGYAGVFGIWNFCSDVVPQSVNAVVGISVGISLALFVVFEIVKMYALQTIAAKQLKAVAEFEMRPDLDLYSLAQIVKERQYKAKRESLLVARRLLLFWKWIFAPTIITGFGGFAILLYNLLAHLTTALPFFPTDI